MITAGDKLQVFEDFRVDRALPKFKGATPDGNGFVMQGDVQWVTVAPSGPSVMVTGPRPRRWLTRAFAWIVSLFARKERPALSIPEFFASVKNTERELDIVQERAKGYESALLRARAAGQQALVEQLESGLGAHRSEAQLVAIGMRRYLTESDVVRFYKQSKRGLRLDWIRNFARLIPQDVVANKSRADEIGLFDNYVVLHYDPDAKSYAETHEEREARRDPILFGVMKGRRILYVIGDWVDELCDLTLDQVADALGADVVKELK